MLCSCGSGKHCRQHHLFVVVEQDLYPCAFDVPLPIAVRTAEYLRGFGLGVEGRPVAAGKEVER